MFYRVDADTEENLEGSNLIYVFSMGPTLSRKMETHPEADPQAMRSVGKGKKGYTLNVVGQLKHFRLVGCDVPGSSLSFLCASKCLPIDMFST